MVNLRTDRSLQRLYFHPLASQDTRLRTVSSSPPPLLTLNPWLDWLCVNRAGSQSKGSPGLWRRRTCRDIWKFIINSWLYWLYTGTHALFVSVTSEAFICTGPPSVSEPQCGEKCQWAQWASGAGHGVTRRRQTQTHQLCLLFKRTWKRERYWRGGLGGGQTGRDKRWREETSVSDWETPQQPHQSQLLGSLPLLPWLRGTVRNPGGRGCPKNLQLSLNSGETEMELRVHLLPH